MNAEIIAVGSELLLGQIANTNAQFISGEFAALGINVYYHTVVGDNAERLASAISIAKSRASIIIFTGGLGPTKDDLTKETVATTLNKTLVYDETSLQYILDYFKKTNRVMTENNKKQALIIEGSKPLANNHGMAPGMLLNEGDLTFILLPGPPSEMRPMFVDYVKPYFEAKQNRHIVSRVMRFFGIGESILETEIIDLIDQQINPTIAPLAKQGEVTLRLTASHESTGVANQLIDEVEKEILSRVGDYFYGYGEKELPEVVFNLLKDKGVTLAAAESLTGGLFSQSLTHFSGASNILKGSIICYTNEAKKQLLDVPESILNSQGAVSEACAISLARNVREKLHADIGISFTGVAGPSKSEGKDVGTVFIGLATKTGTTCLQLNLNGRREAIRLRTILHGYDVIRRSL